MYLVSFQRNQDFSCVEKIELRHQKWLAPCNISAEAQICHDGENLHVRMTAKETEIRHMEDGPLPMVCLDSCLEFFFCPMGNQDGRYFNFEWNPDGKLYLGFGDCRETNVRQLVSDYWDVFSPVPFRTNDGWGIQYRIPGEFIRRYFPAFSFSGSIRANLYKCGDLCSVPHYLAYADIPWDHPDFHRPEFFETMRFE